MFRLCLELELATSMKETRPSMQPDDEDVELSSNLLNSQNQTCWTYANPSGAQVTAHW